MKRRQGKGAPPADLLVCFPTRAHLALMPKPICSPARQPDSTRRHHNNLRKLRNGGASAAKPNPADLSEPTSPKVTCAGQIKIRPKPGSCKNWQSVMQEIEKLHKGKKDKKKPGWIESFGFKKDAMQFLACLRRIRFDLRCFGSFPNSEITSDSDEEDDDDDDEVAVEDDNEGKEGSRRVFSKWFMVLQENQSTSSVSEPVVEEAPPPNALLLMRCRSAPAKSWLEERQEEEERKEEEEEEKKRKEEEMMVVMRYESDLYKLSTDIAKETWVVGGIRDQLSRSRSWKR